ncbi:MAG TPA: hypothetical protein VFR27_07185 [Mycobacterium sp.]|nr:hypothetical protein [Mycobacterium sp.]
MGRHSIPGPDDFADESIDSIDDGSEADYDGDEEYLDPARYLRQPSHAEDDDLDDLDDEVPVDGGLGESSDESGGGRRWQVGQQWQGGHRSEDGRRGVSVGVVAALVAVILIVSTVILWRFFGSSLSHRSDVAAGRCVGGDLAVAVVADPTITDHIQEFADRFNKSAKPVGDRCVSIRVKPADADAVVSGFIGDWPARLGERPALWIPGSSISTARLQASVGREAVSEARTLVTSPVLLAVRPALQPALAKQTWTTLPDLQSNPDALGQFNLPGWGSLRLALPVAGNSDAALLAAEAVAAAATPPGAPPSAGAAAVRTLAGAQPKLADNSLAEAMNVLLHPDDPAHAPVHAVITTEQQLFTRAKSLSDASGLVGSWLPPGAVPVADYPTVLLSGSWLSPEQVSAASEFARFAHKPDQLAELAKAGFRVGGMKPPSSDVTSFADLPATLSVGDDALRATLAGMLTTPAESSVTVMLDRSMTTDEGGRSRLANVVSALDTRIRALPSGSAVGLWTFDGVEGRAMISTGALGDPVNGQPRAAVLATELNGVNSTPGGAVSFTTLRRVYSDASANYRSGQSNSVLVITAGPHTDQTLDAAGLQDYLRQAASPDRPIAVNVIDFGGDPDQPTWQAVAQLSGGSYQHLTSSDSPELAIALGAVLG